MWNWKAFPNVVTILPSYQPCTRVLVALHFSDNTWWCQFNFSPVGACGMVPHCGSICMSLMTKMLNIFSCACWPILHHLLWSVCSNLLAILKLIVTLLLSFSSILYIKNASSLSDMFCWYLLLPCGLLIHFINDVSSYEQRLSFD